MNLKYRNSKNADSIAAFWGKSLDKPDWYKIESLSDDTAEILIYDIIGWPYNDANELVRALAGIKSKEILVRINSPGGDVFDGTAIFNALANHQSKIITRVEGLAASVASVIAIAGKEVQAYSNTMMMIHDPWVLAIGNQYDLREIADILEKIGDNMVGIYTGKTKTGKKEMKQMLADETWLTAKEAKEKGFVDVILESGKGIKGQFDLSIYSHVPDDLLSDDHEPTIRDLERALRDAGLSKNSAKAILARGFKSGSAEAEALSSAIETLKKFQGGINNE